MTTPIPYLASPGSIKTALDKIRAAATPDRVTGDFITTKLQIKGGTGFALIPYLKKIGFVASDGAPTELYRKFRNHATAGAAVAEAIKFGYKELSRVNEYFYELSDKDLMALVVQVTGVAEGNQVAKLTVSTLKMLKSFAVFDGNQALDISIATKGAGSGASSAEAVVEHEMKVKAKSSFNLSYTININLPATSDQAVFNAIFRSLKEHLISDNE